MTTATAPAQHVPHASLDGARLSFVRLVRSEWIKLRSVRSTVWCFALLVVLNIGFPLLIAGVGHFSNAANAHVTAAEAGAIGVRVITLGVNFTSLIVGVLGVLIISGEYATGMIRSTFTADPGRLGAVFAKALVLAVSAFVLSTASTFIAALVVHPILSGKGVDFDLGSSKVLLPLLGSGVYITLIALLAFGVGLLVRTTAGGIAITLGVLLVAPIILEIVSSLVAAHWPADVSAFLPSQAGGQLFAYTSSGAVQPAEAAPNAASVTLNGWQGFGVFAGEVLLVGIAALAMVKRRDA